MILDAIDPVAIINSNQTPNVGLYLANIVRSSGVTTGAASPIQGRAVQRLVGTVGFCPIAKITNLAIHIAGSTIREYTIMLSIFRKKLFGCVADADETIHVVNLNIAQHQLALVLFCYLAQVNYNICCTIHCQDSAVACAGNSTIEVNLAAAGVNILAQYGLGRRIVVQTNTISITFVGGIIDCAVLIITIDEICLVAQNILIGQHRAACSIITVQLVDINLHAVGVFHRIFIVAALDEAVDIDAACGNVNIVAAENTIAAVLCAAGDSCIFSLFFLDSAGFGSSQADIVGILEQVVAIIIVAVCMELVCLVICHQLGNIALNLFGDSLAELIPGNGITTNGCVTVRGLRDRALVGNNLGVLAQNLGVVYVDVAVFVAQGHVAADILHSTLYGHIRIGVLLQILGRNACVGNVNGGISTDCRVRNKGTCITFRNLLNTFLRMDGILINRNTVDVYHAAGLLDDDIIYQQMHIAVVGDGDVISTLSFQSTCALQLVSVDVDVATGNIDIRQLDAGHSAVLDYDKGLRTAFIGCIITKARFNHIALQSLQLCLKRFVLLGALVVPAHGFC